MRCLASSATAMLTPESEYFMAIGSVFWMGERRAQLSRAVSRRAESGKAAGRESPEMCATLKIRAAQGDGCAELPGRALAIQNVRKSLRHRTLPGWMNTPAYARKRAPYWPGCQASAGASRDM